MTKTPQILILAYHRVGIPPQGVRYRGMYVSPKILQSHVIFLRRIGFTFSTVRDAFKESVARKRACVTFDDGYQDNLTLGLPALRALGVPATVFAITDDVGRSGVSWLEAGDKTPSDLMSWEDLKTLQSHGWEIGSHMAEHVHLSRQDYGSQSTLLARSLGALKHNLGGDVATVAYPFGDYNGDSLRVLREQSVPYAVTTIPGMNSIETPAHELRRYCMRGYRYHHRLSALKFAFSSRR